MLDISSDDYLASPRFSGRDRAAVLWAEHVAKNTARERNDVFEEVKRYFSNAEFVELTGICGFFAASNRFQDSLRIPIEEQSEVEKIKKSVRTDPNQIKAFIEKLLEYWPHEFPVPSSGASLKAGIRTVVTGPAAAATLSAAAPRTEMVARVQLLDPKTAQGESARFFNAAEQLLGGVTNAVRMWAHIPHVAKLLLPFHAVIEHEGAGSILPNSLKMMVLIRTGHLNAATYSLAHRTVAGRAAGISAEQLAALAARDCSSSPCFSSRERAALLWAEHVASNTAKRRDDVFEGLQHHFNDAEIVELTGICAMANQLDRIYNALHLPVEANSDVEALSGTIQLDPKRVKAYLEMLVTRWPTEFPIPAD